MSASWFFMMAMLISVQIISADQVRHATGSVRWFWQIMLGASAVLLLLFATIVRY